jgi:hypothetical protein
MDRRYNTIAAAVERNAALAVANPAKFFLLRGAFYA